MRNLWKSRLAIVATSVGVSASSCDCTPEEKEIITTALVALYMKDCFQQHWDLYIQAPPVRYAAGYNNWISVVYIGDTAYEMRWLGGSHECEGSRHAGIVRPEGTIRCLVIGIDRNYTSVAEEFNTEWAAAQDYINQQHQAFATAQGLPGPILQFENTNVVVTEAQVGNADPRDIAAFRAQLLALGHDPDKYDETIIIDLDPHNQNGGQNFGKWSVINWFDLEQAGDVNITPAQWQSFARATYHHELGHSHGWQHHWGDDPGTPFITWPEFFGWTDLDGDGVIEIRDANPYGS
jgi:hypothetical protein